MILTAPQAAVLKAAVLAETDPIVVDARTAPVRDDSALANFYNALATPTFTVWRTSVKNDDIGDAMNGTEVAGLTSADLARLQVLAAYSGGSQNPSRADRRAAFDAVFSGAGGANTRTALAALWRRAATRAEKLLATGIGTDPSPATLGAEGLITPQQMSDALR